MQMQELEGRVLLTAVGPVGSDTYAPGAQTMPAGTGGNEFQVNTFTENDQMYEDIASDVHGNFVVVWQSNAEDAFGYGVFAQMYDADGWARGGEFQVNTHAASNEGLPSVAMDSAGNFVVVWSAERQDNGTFGVYGQRYDSRGGPVGGEFQVNTWSAGDQQGAHVAMDAVGDFVVAYTSVGQDGSGAEVFARRYNSAGEAMGSEFAVNTYTVGDQSASDVAMDAAGDFVIVWTSWGQDGEDVGIYARRYAASGEAIGDEFRVNTTAGGMYNPAVAMDAGGDYVVTWQGQAIYAQRYDSAGAAHGGEMTLTEPGGYVPTEPDVAMNAAGEFVIVWGRSNDTTQSEVYAQQFNAAGAMEGAAFQVNTYTADYQKDPVVTLGAAGNRVIAWVSMGQDGSYQGIYARQYAAESGERMVVGTGGADTLVMQWSGDKVVVGWGDSEHLVGAYSADGALRLKGMAGDDVLRVDFSRGAPIPAGGMTWDGGDGNDAVVLGRTGLGDEVVVDGRGVSVGLALLTLSGNERIELAGSEDGRGRIGRLSVGDSAVVGIAGDGAMIEMAGLWIGAEATVDLGENDVILNHSDGDHGQGKAEELRKWVRSALVGGGEQNPWTGAGLTSTAARDSQNMDRAIAIFNNDDGSGNPWIEDYNGVGVDQNSIVLKYTYSGDADADGRITADDFAAATAGWFDQMKGIAPTWMSGDYDYDGEITADDFALVTGSWFSQDREHPLSEGAIVPVKVDEGRGSGGAMAEARETGVLVMEAPIVFARAKKAEGNVLLVDDLAVLA